MAHTLDELLQDFATDVPVEACRVREENKELQAPILMVLDDDPTGTQSVADLPVLTSWETEDIQWALSTGKPAVYIMTNSRSLNPDAAAAINRDVVRATYRALRDYPDIKVSFVSRSDSTLRGHFPLEPNILADEVKAATGNDVDGIVVIPAFADAGRITIDGIHYAGSIQTGFTPVADTEFAKDATFGYKNSSLAKWIEEKTEGEVTAKDVIAIDLTTLRTDPEGTVEKLKAATNRQPVICDSVTEDDLRLLALALNKAESAGSRFLYRVGPPFVRARIGQEIHPPLTKTEIDAARTGKAVAKGGLIVIGSHVDLTTRQLNHLREDRKLQEYEIDVAQILDTAQRDDHLRAIIDQATAVLDKEHVIIRTSRKLITGKDAQSSLDISRQVSASVVEVVQQITKAIRPRFVIAKGGITSSDVASKGLEIKHATVIGPMLEGIVSLWRGENKPSKGIPYIVFAGNVGDETSLSAVVDKLTA
ncbi:MAG: four-carbon acid sugar kinase family protein [Actinomycetaceae bacterium]|nr:four-carbon acid sugar kinase family protein [Actinomycetaceae bacterium]